MNNRRAVSLMSILLTMIIILGSSPLRAIHFERGDGSPEFFNIETSQDTTIVYTDTEPRNNIISLDILIMFPAIGYSRLVPLSKNTGLSFYGSVTPFFGFVIDLGGAVTVGKNHHYFEPGGGYLLFADNFYLKAGYRYQSRRGFVFRIAPGYSITENVPWFTASFGYAF
jgi:hypothetical protein